MKLVTTALSVTSDSDPDPNPGGQKWPTKNRKKLRNFMVWNAGCSLFKTEGFFCSLNVLYGGLEISKIAIFFYQKNIIKNFHLYIFYNFWSSKPWIRIGQDPDRYRYLFSPKCWIRIRNQWIRIRNTAGNTSFKLLIFIIETVCTFVACRWESLK